MAWKKTPVLMENKTQGPNLVGYEYTDKQKAMSAKKMVVDLYWQKEKQFAFMVNEQVFNPIKSIAAHQLVNFILSEKIIVAGKKVIDLGCGSGVIGLSAITKKAQKVLFTDINPHINIIEDHPLFRPCDEWQVQNLLANVPDKSYDCILGIPPAMVTTKGQQISTDTFESGIYRPQNFYAQIFADSGRALTSGGQLVIWLRFKLTSLESLIEVFSMTAHWFDMKKTALLADGIESLICLDHEPSLIERWTYKLKKGGVSNDGIWMFLSLTKQ